MSLTEQQRRYAEARMEGRSKKEAALLAGCPEKTAAQAASRLEKHPSVLAHLARLKACESSSVPGAGSDVTPPGLEDGGELITDPKDYLVSVMNDRKADPKTKIQAAIALLPFTHQKLGESGKKEQKDRAAESAVTGRFSPAAPPPSQLKLVR